MVEHKNVFSELSRKLHGANDPLKKRYGVTCDLQGLDDKRVFVRVDCEGELGREKVMRACERIKERMSARSGMRGPSHVRFDVHFSETLYAFDSFEFDMSF
ncbi:hypothetical protein FUAX_25450 [Fulvitalea axinellae]|uniref:Uncharacterized protein n=1 Tax=Fulvitalea axinellae TaxID=1182444 RepID=A0AAU9CPX6_9BACT|nr:hypothetical protein FUAX_25450 [Fulvitalea axinellae]